MWPICVYIYNQEPYLMVSCLYTNKYSSSLYVTWQWRGWSWWQAQGKHHQDPGCEGSLPQWMIAALVTDCVKGCSLPKDINPIARAVLVHSMPLCCCCCRLALARLAVVAHQKHKSEEETAVPRELLWLNKRRFGQKSSHVMWFREDSGLRVLVKVFYGG